MSAYGGSSNNLKDLTDNLGLLSLRGCIALLANRPLPCLHHTRIRRHFQSLFAGTESRIAPLPEARINVFGFAADSTLALVPVRWDYLRPNGQLVRSAVSECVGLADQIALHVGVIPRRGSQACPHIQNQKFGGTDGERRGGPVSTSLGCQDSNRILSGWC